ncbi:unnamed protein product, partial [Polarella glacialis]
VLLALGAPDLEEQFQTGQFQVLEVPGGRTFEATLPRLPASRPLQGLSAGPPSRERVLAGLDRLTLDFEGYAQQLQQLNSGGGSSSSSGSRAIGSDAGASCRGRNGFDQRLDSASEQVLVLAMQLKAGLQAPASAAAPYSRGHSPACEADESQVSRLGSSDLSPLTPSMPSAVQ